MTLAGGQMMACATSLNIAHMEPIQRIAPMFPVVRVLVRAMTLAGGQMMTCATSLNIAHMEPTQRTVSQSIVLYTLTRRARVELK